MLQYKDILKAMPIYWETSNLCEQAVNCDSIDTALYINALAPAMVEYVRWVLTDAAQNGIKRLYFLARDGYQMYISACKLKDILGLDMECRYLCVSRFAMRIPEYHLLGVKCLDHICLGGIDVTFEKIMHRAGLSGAEAMEIAEICGYAGRYKDILNYKEIIQLKEILAGQEKFLEYIYINSAAAYESAAGYLLQEGLQEDIPYAFVDSGWVGTLQQTIENLLKSKGYGKNIKGYYFGLYKIPGNTGGKYSSYYFSPKTGLRKKVYFSNCLFEAIYSAPEGMTLRYCKTVQNGRDVYVPVLDRKENPNAAQIRRNCKTLETFLDILESVERRKPVLQGQPCRTRMVERLLSSFMGKPGAEEVEAYGNTLFSDDVLEGSMQNVAANLTEQDILNQRFINKALIMTGIRKKTIHESAWIEGSIVRNRRQVQRNLYHARIYKYFVYMRKALQ